MKHVIVIPERYRLGDTISFKVRRVASLVCDRLTVCCPVAWRFLYPTATDFVDVSEDLNGWGERLVVRELKNQFPEADFVKVSWSIPAKTDIDVTPISANKSSCDVLVAPRGKATSSPHRNWEGWPSLTSGLVDAGLRVIAAGKEDMSSDCGLTLVTNLDEIAAAMLGSRFVVSTDSGLAHLAILLKVPLILLWGDDLGVIPGQTYKQGCHARMESQKRAPVHHIIGAWNNHELALREVIGIIKQ
jgi:hypothetical protein